MNPIKFPAGAIIVVLGLLFSSYAPASDWTLAKEQDGVQVFSRVAEASKYREYQGEVEVNAKPDAIVRLLQNLDSLPEWHYSLQSAKLVKTLGYTDALVHIIISPPWPLKKRDVISEVSLEIDEANDLIRITLRDQPDHLPEDAAYQRIPRLRAEWQIRSASDTTSLVRYQTYTEPGGEIPTWFYNNVAMDVPLFTLLNLRRRFE